MLQRHGFVGTFFVPVLNREGLPVLSRQALRDLAATHEVGSHTLDHLYLKGATREVIRHQIQAGKAGLEEILTRSVPGFCYPGGKFNSAVTAEVRRAGFQYARTTEDLTVRLPRNSFLMGTTLQFFPHGNAVFTRHMIKGPRRLQKMSLYLRLLTQRCFRDRLRVAARYAQQSAGVLHIWGHSWELERFGLWHELSEFLKFVTDLGPVSLPMRALLGQQWPESR
jgi:peptidoglycan-N-acetylglucosamine deacetylase